LFDHLPPNFFWGLIIFQTFSDCGFLLSGSAPVLSTYMFGIAMNICIGRVATYILDKKKFLFLVMAAILDTERR
jgi:hypothetical protein